MQLDSKDMARLWDILDAARTAVEFTIDQSYEQFVKDRKTRNAVERNLEIIGEAARHVSGETKKQLPSVPWKSIIGFRNILVHEYGEIRYEVVWSIIQEKLNPLIQELKDFGVESPPSIEDEV